MKPVVRLCLLPALVVALGLTLSTAAQADHEFDDHVFCAQGGGQGGPASGGPGGTLPDGNAAGHFAGGGGEAPDNVLVPRHLAERFGEEPVPPGFPDPDAGEQFIEVDADIVGGDGGGSSGSAFHGGHGGGPGGGQGGSAFFGGGDGGCGPNIFETVDRPRRPPHRVSDRLPVTGTATEQLGILAGLFIALGGTLWMVARANRAALATAPTGIEADNAPVAVRPPRRGHVVVSRLKEQVAGSWLSGGRGGS